MFSSTSLHFINAQHVYTVTSIHGEGKLKMTVDTTRFAVNGKFTLDMAADAPAGAEQFSTKLQQEVVKQN